MKKCKRSFSKEHHAEVGQKLYETRNFLVHLYTEFANSYGATHTGARLIHRSYEAIDTLRCELDNVLAKEAGLEEWLQGSLRDSYYPSKP